MGRRGSRRLSRGVLVGGSILALLGVLALAAPWLAPNPGAGDLDRVLERPTRDHPLGTDGLGRDVAARVAHGARVSLAVGLLSAAVALMLGVPLGAAAGYVGGTVDGAIARLMESLLSFPPLLLVLALLTTAPAWLLRLPDTTKLAIVLGGLGWIPVARYLRGEFIRLKAAESIQAVRAAGAGHWRLIVRHLLPAALTPVFVTSSFAVGRAIVAEAALSFIGLGVRPPTPTWGGLLNDARHHVDQAWWMALFPGVALFLVVLACNLLGEGLRDALDPARRRSR